MKKEKLYIIKKYIMATSAQAALRKEKRVNADDVWMDDDYRKAQTNQLPPAIGFGFETED